MLIDNISSFKTGGPMKYHSFIIILFTLVFGWHNTGCYTQMQMSYDLDRPTQVKENEYYSWDDDERTSLGYDWSSTKQTSNPNYSKKLYGQNGSTSNSIDETNYEDFTEQGIYYKDYETEQWYDEHYIDVINSANYERNFQVNGHDFTYDQGYEKGFDRGYDRGYNRGYRDSWFDDDFWGNWYAKRWWRLHVGWWGGYYGYYSAWSPSSYWAWSGYGDWTWFSPYDPFYHSWNGFYGFNSYRYGYYGHIAYWGYSPYGGNTIFIEQVNNNTTSDKLRGARRYGLSSSSNSALTRGTGKNASSKVIHTRSASKNARSGWESTPSSSTRSRSIYNTLGNSRSTGRTVQSSSSNGNNSKGTVRSSGSRSTGRSSGSSSSVGRSNSQLQCGLFSSSTSAVSIFGDSSPTAAL